MELNPIKEKLSIDEKTLNILLVEDNPGDVFIIKDLIKSTGTRFSIRHSSLLAEAIQLSGQQDFDVILLDLGLPDSIGLDTLKKLQVSKIKAPVVVMTGLDDEDIALASLKEGAQDYLVKNRLTSEYIHRAIRYSIERKRIQEIEKRHAHQFSILSSATVEINKCEDISSIYQVICDNIKSLLGEQTILAIEFKDNKIANVSGSEWIEAYLNYIKQNSQLKIPQTRFEVSNYTEDVLRLYQNGKLNEIEGGIYEVLGGHFSRENCRVAEKILGLTKTYVMGFSKSEKSYGGVIIFSRKTIEPDQIKIMESISNQAALNIYKRHADAELKTSEKRYKELFIKVKEAKESLQKLNEELEIKVNERTKDLQRANENLQKSNATKDKFFGIIAHDLKNPFATLLGASELLFDYTEKFDPNKIKQLSKSLHDAAGRGYSLLENLLEWSRAQTGAISFNPQMINIQALIQETLLDIEVYASNKKISLHSKVDNDILLVADKNMLNTILRNLLNNAVKFTHEGGEVFIIAEKDNHTFKLTIKDTGTGIPKKDIVKLFRIDVKYTNPGTARETGTGLGLLLCKEFVEKHGGKIWVESILNKGSEFIVTIPLIDPE